MNRYGFVVLGTATHFELVPARNARSAQMAERCNMRIYNNYDFARNLAIFFQKSWDRAIFWP